MKRISQIVKILVILVLSISCQNNLKITQDEQNELKIDSLIQQMTLEDKVGMIHASASFYSGGVERLGIPELIMSDGPHGVRFEHGRDWIQDNAGNDSATYLPTAICLASTWNTELGYQYGVVLGSEAKERGKDVILGPGVNIIRSPLCGRNFEYLSEDPFLSSRMGVGYIKGVQDQGIAACVKHYVANNQEENRSGINVLISEQALREIYLPAFKVAVEEANVLSVMGAYNKVRGAYCAHSNYLVNTILKGEWGFKGILMSDWAAVHSTKEALLNGTDIEMGTDLSQMPDIDYNKFFLADSALALLKSGQIPVSVVDDKVRRILRVMFKTNKFGTCIPGERNTKEHQQLALKVAEEGIVLLKNEHLLPLEADKKQRILVVGANAVRKYAHGGGSSQVNTLYEVTPLEGIKNKVGSQVIIDFEPGYEITRENSVNNVLRNKAVEAARRADAVIIVGGWIHNFDHSEWATDAFDNEAVDKKNLKMLYGQEQLIQEIVGVNRNTTVVLFGGGPLDMSSWVNEIKALLMAWYPGMEGGNALANILFGKSNPSGKLPMTFAKKLEDYPSHSLGEFPGQNMEVNYDEGIYVGYRYFDTYQIEPEFCFGHGLSYTQFEYSDLMLEEDDESVVLTCFLTNIGKIKGSEVVQVYVTDNEAKVKRPAQELKAFTKIELEPNESATVELKVSKNSLKYFNEKSDQWEFEPGEFEFKVGASSRDIKLAETIEL
jgi:beta-glucosidase